MRILLRIIIGLAAVVVGGIATIILVAYVLLSIHRNAPRPTISLKEFETIDVGMTIGQVEAVLGKRYLSETYESGIDRTGSLVYDHGYDMVASWGNDSTHSHLNVYFKEGKVIKVQYSDYDYSVPGTAATKTKP